MMIITPCLGNATEFSDILCHTGYYHNTKLGKMKHTLIYAANLHGFAP